MEKEAETIYQLWKKFIVHDADKKQDGTYLEEVEVSPSFFFSFYSIFLGKGIFSIFGRKIGK